MGENQGMQERTGSVGSGRSRPELDWIGPVPGGSQTGQVLVGISQNLFVPAGS